MKTLFIIVIILTTSLFSAKETVVTVLTRYMIVTGTIIKYDDEKVIIHGEISEMPGNITISKSNIEINPKDILLIDYGISSVYENETDSTKKADLLNLSRKILPEGI